MANRIYTWNQTLKFSWGHIIAFVALIFISYVSYMGDFYQNGGNFIEAAVKVFVIDILLLATFIGAQIIKGTDEKFARRIIIERILIVLCPITFFLAMLPYNHFWAVFSQREQIEGQFKEAVETSRQMFSDYDYYSEKRINSYTSHLTDVIANKAQDAATYSTSGFNGKDDAMIKANYIETLSLQLKSENTDSLRRNALEWIDKANQGASVWNAFLVGNVSKISEAIDGWNQALIDVSKPVLSNEAHGVQPFDADKESFKAVDSHFKGLMDIYTTTTRIRVNTIWTAAILLLMLLFPYLLQERNLRAQGYYSLFGRKNNKEEKRPEDFNFEDTREKNTNVDSKPEDPSDDDVFSGTF